MNELLARVLDAHGGMDRWQKLRRIHLQLSISGFLFEVKGLPDGMTDILMSTGTAVVGILALGAGLGGWIRATANALERALATTGGLLLFYAGSLSDAAGLALFGIAIALHLARTKKQMATA